MTGSTGWDFDSNKGGGNDGDKVEYTKFPEGITRLRLVDEAPYIRWIHWLGKFQRSVTCPGRGCPICEIRKQEKANKIKNNTYNMQKKFAMHVINRENGKLEIMEQGKTVFEDIRDLKADLEADGKTLIEADLRFRRRGTKQDDTTYRVDIDEKYPLSDADKKLLESKVDFDEYYKPQTPEQILELIQVKENFKEEWNRILGFGTQEEETAEDEEIEIQ